jgi:hypothetical protein
MPEQQQSRTVSAQQGEAFLLGALVMQRGLLSAIDPDFLLLLLRSETDEIFETARDEPHRLADVLRAKTPEKFRHTAAQRGSVDAHSLIDDKTKYDRIREEVAAEQAAKRRQSQTAAERFDRDGAY